MRKPPWHIYTIAKIVTSYANVFIGPKLYLLTLSLVCPSTRWVGSTPGQKPDSRSLQYIEILVIAKTRLRGRSYRSRSFNSYVTSSGPRCLLFWASKSSTGLCFSPFGLPSRNKFRVIPRSVLYPAADTASAIRAEQSTPLWLSPLPCGSHSRSRVFTQSGLSKIELERQRTRRQRIREFRKHIILRGQTGFVSDISVPFFLPIQRSSE